MIYNPHKKYEFILPQLKITNEEYIIKNQDDSFNVLDKDWIRLSILPELTEYDKDDIKFLFKTSAMTETMNTAPGEHLALNPPYKFTRYADVPEKGRLFGREDLKPDSYGENLGVGPMYSKLIQENMRNRLVYIQAGVPEFQNLFSFFLSSVNYADAIVAREGRYPYAYKATKIIATVAMFRVFPIFTGIAYVIMAIDKVVGLSSPKYYSLKPTMQDYWASVTMIVNSFAVERGIFQINLDNDNNENKLSKTIKVDSEQMKELHQLYPSIFGEDGLVNVYGIVGKYQKIIYEQLQTEHNILKKGSVNEEVLKQHMLGIIKPQDKKSDLEKFRTSVAKLRAFKSTKDGLPENNPVPKSAKDVDIKSYTDKRSNDYERTILPHQKTPWFEDAAKYFNSAITEGGAELILYTDAPNSMTDTFSNSTKNMPIENVINNIGGAFRDIRFSISDGNLLGSIVQNVTNGLKDAAAGVIDGITIGIGGLIQALSGGGFLEFPLMWDDSSAEIATETISIPIHLPYSHPIVMLTKVDMVIASILALGLPKQIGRTAYTSPPLCSVYIEGVMNMQLAIVDRITIRRATSNLKYTDDGVAIGFDIDVTFKDLSKIVSTPINSGTFGVNSLVFDDYAGINRYIKTIASRPYYVDKYMSRSVLLKLSKTLLGIKSFMSPESIGMRLGLSAPAELVGRVLPVQNGVAMFGGYEKLQ